MHTLVLLRHGQSVWNLENRFTGWTDVGLTPHGEAEAVAPEDIIGEIEGQADPASPLDVIIDALEDDAASGETPPRESE